MRILISLSYFTPNISGLSLYAKDLAEALARKGETVRVLTSQFKKDLQREETIEKVHIIRVPVATIVKKVPFMPLFLLYAIKEVKKADIINCHFPQPEGLFLILLAKFFGKKIVVTYQTDLEFDSVSFQIIKSFLVLFNYISLLCATNIVAITKDYALHSPILSKFLSKTSYILPVIHKPNFDKDEQKQLEKKVFRKGRKICIGFLGRMSTEKGLEYLLEAIPYLNQELKKDFLVVIAGAEDVIGEEKYKEKIMKIIEKYKEQVIVLGKLTRNQVGAFYSLLDVFVLPSINATEAFGIVQIEAMLFNVPVVATNLPGVRIPVTETKMGELVPPRDVVSLARAIAKILAQRKKYATGEAKHFLQDMFTEQNIAEGYMKIFQ